MSFLVELKKENFKFSGTHFTIFDAAHAERLHGHNYYVSVQLEMADVQKDLGFLFDFNLVKPMVKRLCEKLDERVLIPQNSPFLKIQKTATEVEVNFNQKHYRFPFDDVVLLPIANVTVEELSRLICTQLITELKNESKFEYKKLNYLSVGVEETHGQRVVFQLRALDLHGSNATTGN